MISSHGLLLKVFPREADAQRWLTAIGALYKDTVSAGGDRRAEQWQGGRITYFLEVRPDGQTCVWLGQPLNNNNNNNNKGRWKPPPGYYDDPVPEWTPEQRDVHKRFLTGPLTRPLPKKGNKK